VRCKDDEGEVVMLFTSEARADEGLKAGKVPENTFCVASMAARDMLEVLGRMKMRALLNRSCTTGSLILPPTMMLDAATGEALKPLGMGSGHPERRTFNLIDPADYPTNLIQPLFEVLRSDRKFRAAWVLKDPAPTEAGGTRYMFLLLMDPRDEVLAHDFNLVLNTAFQRPDDVSFSFMNEKDPDDIRATLKLAAPFYRAPDFEY